MDVLRLTLRQLQIFVSVAQWGSTAAASQHIALSQSATSAALNELERLLSLQLFDRAKKRLILNDNGRALLPKALALLDGATDIERMAHDVQIQTQLLRIGASTTIGNYLLPSLLRQHLSLDGPMASMPWQSQVMIGNTAEVCAAVANFELDVGLIEGPCHEPGLLASKWLRDDLILVTAPNSPVGQIIRQGPPKPVSTSLLREQVWLLREHGSGTREATDQALLPHLNEYARSIELGSSESIKHAVAQGLGIACLSAWVVADLLSANKLIRIPTTFPAITRQCHLVIHREKHQTAALRQFIEMTTVFNRSYDACL